jgi:ATP-dependent helicase HepA
MRTGLTVAPDKAITAAIRIMDYVADRYRVYRRVLRNRRQTLVRDGKLQRVQRVRDITKYRAGLLETSAITAVNELLSQSRKDTQDLPILRILARLIWQSLDFLAVYGFRRPERYENCLRCGLDCTFTVPR